MVEKSLYDYDKTQEGEKKRKRGGEWKEGYCTVCTTKRAPYKCVKCGSTVCTEHFVSIMGLCVECAPVKNRARKSPSSVMKEEPLAPIHKDREDRRTVIIHKTVEKKLDEKNTQKPSKRKSKDKDEDTTIEWV